MRVTQPRKPCFKFNAIMGDRLAGKKMAQTGFCGFYLSVASEGSIDRILIFQRIERGAFDPRGRAAQYLGCALRAPAALRRGRLTC